MTPSRPRVTVALPVYNGENFVREAIGSILSQTFTDFELVISDNASSDRTGAICAEAAAGDGRVRYHRAETNRGLAWNHNRAFALARGRYLIWLGHDDRIEPEYLARCVAELERDPAAVLCYSNSFYIDERGGVLKRLDFHNSCDSDSPSERFKNIIPFTHGCDPVLGLIRADALKQTRLHGPYADSDRVLLAELGLRGRFRLLPEYLLARRMHDLQATRLYRHRRDRARVFDPSTAGKAVYPYLREFADLLTAIQRARIPWRERLRCHRHLLGWLLTNRHWMREDLAEGLKFHMRRFLSEGDVQGLKSLKRRLLGRSVA